MLRRLTNGEALARRDSKLFWNRNLTRRDFLYRTAATSLSLTGLAALGACTPSPQRRARNEAPQFARPDSPVALPVYDDNPPLEDGLEPEVGATLRIYNWEEYLRPRVIDEFAAKYEVEVEISTFSDMDDALATLRSGSDFDLFFHRIDVIGRLVEERLLRPLNHSYIPNFMSNSWLVYQDPFYDLGARYGVPYTLYTTGIMWRADRVDEDIAALPNPYEIFWNERYQGRVHLLDDYREVISMVLLKNGVTDLNTGDAGDLATVADDLATLAGNVGGLDVDGYTDVPSGDAWIHQAWSGDAIASPYYFPKGDDPAVIRYWFPPDGAGSVGNDCIGVLRDGPNPVLAHLFIDHLFDLGVATRNFEWNGYQPPVDGLNPRFLVEKGFVPGYIRDAVVDRAAFNRGFMQLELPSEIDDEWHRVWGDFANRV